MKTSKAVLDSVADDGRFSKAEVATLAEDIAQWVENAEGVGEQLTALVDMDLDIDTEVLSGIGGERFAGVKEALDTIEGAQSSADEIRGYIEDFRDTWSSMEDAIAMWLDEDTEREDRAQARADMVSYAEELRDHLGALVTAEIDVTA